MRIQIKRGKKENLPNGKLGEPLFVTDEGAEELYIGRGEGKAPLKIANSKDVEAVKSGKVDRADIVDNLESDDGTKVLSAKQGKELKVQIDNNKQEVDSQIKDKANKATIDDIQQQVNNLVLGAVGDGNNAEVVQARSNYATLNDRISNKLDISNIRKLKISNIPKTDGARISCNNGDILNIPGWSYINLDVSNSKYMLIATKSLGASDLGCAFYDSTNTYISGIRTGNNINAKLIIPENAKYFKYGLTDSDWETYKDNYITLCDNITNFNDLNNKVTMLEENDKENQPELGIMDNKLPYLWHKYGNLYNLNNPVNYSNSREKNSLYVSGEHHTQSGVVSPSFTSYFTIKKSDSITYYTVRNQSGAVCEFNDATISSGDVICQTNTTNKMVDVIYVDDEKIVISIIETVKAYTINAFSDKNYTIAAELKIDIDKSSVFYTVYDKNSINYNYKYLSRAEKLNSKIMGKNLFIFSDSQSSFINVLAQDYGANVFHITNGGCRMGYVSDTGLGGETGSNNNLWLCNSTRVNNFNNLFLNNTGLKIDYIINFTGGNGPFESIGTADDLKYILSHKKWFGDDSQDDPFDALSEEDKLRFTSPLCYLASFITINKVFPRAIPVVCDLYNYVGESYSFTNETWENLNDLVDVMYNENAGGKKKSLLLHDLAKMIGAILVKASECGYAYTNIPYYGSDRVHGNFQSATNLAHLIANHISFVPRIEEQYLE